MAYNPDSDYETYEIKRIDRAEKLTLYRCPDGYCGADDCDRCHPGWQFNSEQEEEYNA